MRRVQISALTDALALAFPVGAALAWLGCLMSSCAYGQEVRSLADHSPLVVSELRDIYGALAPRYNTQVFGVAWSLLTLAMAALLAWRGALAGRRLWAALAIYIVGALLIAGQRAAPMPRWAGLREYQWLDAGVILSCVAAFTSARIGERP